MHNKTYRMTVCLARLRPASASVQTDSDSLLFTWRIFGSLATSYQCLQTTNQRPIKHTDKPAGMDGQADPSLWWVHTILLVLRCPSSNMRPYTIWAVSWEKGSKCLEFCDLSNTHAQPLERARDAASSKAIILYWVCKQRRLRQARLSLHCLPMQ